MSDQNALLYSIVMFLKSLEKSSSIDSAVSLIETSLKIQETPENFSRSSYYPLGLQEIFDAGVVALSAQTPAQALESVEDNPKFESFVSVVSKKGFFEGAEVGSVEYLQRQAKLVKKFIDRKNNEIVSAAEAEKLAEEKKGLGNAAIVAKDYEGAVAFYTEALELSADGPNSHIYHCNRAAALCHLNSYIEAVEDCNASLLLQPNYVKAYSRLGLANYFLERYEEAVAAYEEAQVLEPDNKSTRASLTQARGKIADLEKRSTLTNSSAPSSTGGMDMSALAGMMGGGGLPPGLDGMMKNPAMKEAMARVGGTDGLADLMKNPQMMAMAQKMMKDPQMIQEAMSMMGGKGGGGMPDMAALAGMMGGAGGGSGSSSSGRGGAREPFRGFQDEDA